MTVENAIMSLRGEMDRLEQRLLELRVTAVEDRPTGGARVAEAFGETAEDLVTQVQESMHAVECAVESARYPADFNRVRHALGNAQRLHHDVLECSSTRLLAYERLLELHSLAKSGPEWRAWLQVALCAAENCRAPLLRVNRELFHCWMEMAERAPS